MIDIDILSWFLVAQKVFFIACSIIFFIFSLLVVKQVTSMSKNIKDRFNSILVSFSYISLAFAIFLIFLVVVWL